MSDRSYPVVTGADVRALAARQKGLHALLNPAEQALLHLVLRRAAGHGGPLAPDTTGVAWGTSLNPFISLDAVDPSGVRDGRRR
jgi:hypothetical protein